MFNARLHEKSNVGGSFGVTRAHLVVVIDGCKRVHCWIRPAMPEYQPSVASSETREIRVVRIDDLSPRLRIVHQRSPIPAVIPGRIVEDEILASFGREYRLQTWHMHILLGPGVGTRDPAGPTFGVVLSAYRLSGINDLAAAIRNWRVNPRNHSTLRPCQAIAPHVILRTSLHAPEVEVAISRIIDDSVSDTVEPVARL